MSAPAEAPAGAPIEAAAARVECEGRVLAEALTLRLRGPRVTLIGDASAVLGPLLRRAQVARGIFRVFGEDVAGARTPLALVPRDPPLPADLTPLAFVAWGARLGRGLPRRQADDAAAEACERVGLGPGARAPLGRSPLLARRLTLLAHAAALEPRLVVVEDPLEGLGPDDVGHLLRALDQAIGRAHAIVSTPRADAASPGQALARGADEVVLLEGGRVLGQGRPDEVFAAFAASRSAPAGHAPPVSSAAPTLAPAPAPAAPPAAPQLGATAAAPARGPVAAPTPALAPNPAPSALAPSPAPSALAPNPAAAALAQGPTAALAQGPAAPAFAPSASAASTASPSFLSTASQRMTRLASEPFVAPMLPEVVPPSQRTTRLREPGVPLPGMPAAPQSMSAEPAPLTRRAVGVEPTFGGGHFESGEPAPRAARPGETATPKPAAPAESDAPPSPRPEPALAGAPVKAVPAPSVGPRAASTPSVQLQTPPDASRPSNVRLEPSPAPNVRREAAPPDDASSDLLLSSGDFVLVSSAAPPPPALAFVPPPRPSAGLAAAPAAEPEPQAPLLPSPPDRAAEGPAPAPAERPPAEATAPAERPQAEAAPAERLQAEATAPPPSPPAEVPAHAAPGAEKRDPLGRPAPARRSR